MGCAKSSAKLPASTMEQEIPSCGLDDVDKSNINFLTAEQHEVILSTWAIMAEKDKFEVGSKVFLQIFKMKPEIKNIFHFEDMSEEALVRNTRYRFHAVRFVNVVERVIEYIHHPNLVLKPMLYNLGRSHDTSERPDNFIMYMDTFVTAMDRVWQWELGPAYTEKAEQAWLVLFNLIGDKVKEGFLTARMAKYCSLVSKQVPNGHA